MLTATAVCRRAPSINVRISISNLGILGLSDPDLVAASFPFHSVRRFSFSNGPSINAPGSLGGSARCLMNLSRQWKHFVLMTTKSGPLGLYSLGEIGSVARPGGGF
jgi:hypothetical protein